MIPVPSRARVWLATGVTDMRRGMNTLALPVQQGLGRDPRGNGLDRHGGSRYDWAGLVQDTQPVHNTSDESEGYYGSHGNLDRMSVSGVASPRNQVQD